MNLYEKEGARQARMQMQLSERQIFTELNEEFSLPDYQPEIKRLLQVRAKLSGADPYVGAGSAECSGTVDYSILYSGNDGAMYCFHQTGEYRFASPLELPSDIDVGDGILCDVESVPEMISGRVTSPRNLSVKCRLRSCVRLYGSRTVGELLSGDAGGLERLHGEAESARVFLGTGEPFQLADEILCDGKEQDLRVIYADGQVFVTEVTAGSGNVNCRGELCLRLLCAKEDTAENTPPHEIRRRIPFASTVAVDGVEVNCDACARGDCTDLNVTVEEGRILCEASLILRVRAQRNERIAYTRDLYSTERACEASYETVSLPQAIKCLNGNFSLNTAMPLEEAGLRAGMTVADVSAVASLTTPEAERGKYYLNGKCRVHLILMEGGELTVQELELPFRYEADGGKELPVFSELAADVLSCRARIDGERIGVDAEIAVSGALRGAEEIRMLSEARFGGEWKPKGAVRTVCYPMREDTLWSVARRYHCPVSALVEGNSLPSAPAVDVPESLAGVKYLLV